MRSAVSSLAWEFWTSNRRGWTLVLSAIPLCAVLYRLLPQPINRSDLAEFFIFLPFFASIVLATGFCIFTDQVGKNYVAGFPRHLFTRPVTTKMLVTCVMGFSVLSVAGIYVAWVMLVFAPLGVDILVRWPATVIATGVVLYQAIVWCLSGFRITRVVVLSLTVTLLVGITVLRFAPELSVNFLSPRWIEAELTAVLVGMVALAYVASLVTVTRQRRGSALGWTGAWRTIEKVIDAIPRRTPALRSADAALTWLEWRRNSLLLPALVGFVAILILGPAMEISGRGPRATFRAVQFLAILPLVLAYPIGKGFAKPDLWSMELILSPFFIGRPISSAQIVTAKMKAAAWSTFAAWTILLVVATPWLYATCNLRDLRESVQILATIYSHASLWAISILGLLAAMVITWSFLVGSIWLGQSGRPGVYYTIGGALLIVYLTLMLAGLVRLVDSSNVGADRLAGMFLTWLPWVLATLVTLKIWSTIAVLWQAGRNRQISKRSIIAYACLWFVATACLVALAGFISPRVIWLRDSLILSALLVVPLARIAAAPLTVSWNRHR